MGAEQFINHASGASAKEAFLDAKSQAEYDHGHSGYSGTLAEKSSFTLFEMPNGLSEHDLLEHCWEEASDHPEGAFLNRVYRGIDDKWGPAGAVELPCDEDCKHEPLKHFVFFGWASS